MPLTPFQGFLRPLGITNAKPDAVVLAKIKFGQITVKMLAIDVLVNADDAALEDREKSFKRVGMHVTARPLELGVVDPFVLGEAAEL